MDELAARRQEAFTLLDGGSPMTTPHAVQGSIQFSIQLATTPNIEAWATLVRRAEDCGFSSLSLPDHLLARNDHLAPLVGLSAAAALTSSIRLATTVLNNDFRHPVLLAREVASLDVLSGGRVELGLGAGWLRDEYARTGIAAWERGEIRVARLTESIQLLRQLLTGEAVDFHGEHYQVDGVQVVPRPAQRPIPITIGAFGPVMLDMAARLADGVNLIAKLGTEPDLRRATFERQVGIVRAAAEGRAAPPTIGVRVLAGAVRFDRTNFVETVARTRTADAEDIADSPYVLVGGLEEIKERILELHATFGVSRFTLTEELAWAIAPIVAELSAG